jgi:hypothetical protein
MTGRLAHATACGVLGAALLSGCGSGGSAEEPRPTPTRSLDVPSPTRSVDVPSPTRSRPAESDEPTDEATTEPTTEPTEPIEPTEPTDRPSLPDRSRDTARPSPEEPTAEPVQSEGPGAVVTLAPSPQPTESAAVEPSTSSATTTEEGDSVPPWVWWLLAALLVAAVAGAGAAWAHSRRKQKWREELRDVEGEVRWFAYALLPELRASTTFDQVDGGWRTAADRVSAAEDRLTVLEGSAPNEEYASRARALRDAVRVAAQRLDSIANVAPHDTWALDLDDVAAGLQAAVGPAPDLGP